MCVRVCVCVFVCVCANAFQISVMFQIYIILVYNRLIYLQFIYLCWWARARACVCVCMCMCKRLSNFVGFQIYIILVYSCHIYLKVIYLCWWARARVCVCARVQTPLKSSVMFSDWHYISLQSPYILINLCCKVPSLAQNATTGVWFVFFTSVFQRGGPPSWPSGEGVHLESGRSQVRIPLALGYFRSRVIPVI